jgi:preprotein translocase subunit YajC
MFLALQLLADGGTEPPQAQPSMLPLMLALAGIMILYYFFMARPVSKRQEQERQALFANLKKNDEVVTTGGIIGIVANVSDKEDEVTLKVDESSNVRVRVLKSSILRNLSKERLAKEEKAAKT